MRSILLFFLITISVSFNGSFAKAQELDQLHDKIKQNWAFPDCGSTIESVVFTSRFYLKSAPDSLTLTSYNLKPGGQDYLTLNRGASSAPVHLENDGILKIGIPKDTAGKPAKWESFGFDHTEEYTGCAKPATSFPKAITRLLRYLDRIHDQCVASLDNECARVLFKLADENSDQVLSDAEIRKAVLTALLFAELADRQTLNDADIKALAEKAKTESQAVSADLLAHLDQNRSKSLDYNEVMTHFKAPKLPIIKEILTKSGELIPLFGIVAKAL